jgi:hypothetical protein
MDVLWEKMVGITKLNNLNSTKNSYLKVVKESANFHQKEGYSYWDY